MKVIILLSLLLCWPSLFGYEVKIRVIDDLGVPVSGAQVVVSFVMFRNESDIEYAGVTEKDGAFTATGQGEHSVFVAAVKKGHYEAKVRRLPNDRDINLSVVIPRILKPVPLYAWNVRVGQAEPGLHFPAQNEWLGFDFEVCDWVPPHGKGKVVDIRFKFRNAFLGYEDNIKNLVAAKASSKRAYAARKEEWTEEKFKLNAGKWDAELEISFPSEKEGLFEETRFLSYSQLKLPHLAPVEGYSPTWSYTSRSYSPRTARNDVGFFLRTRVKLDRDGNIVSANYTKVVGDFYLVPQGSLLFTYYFNPTPNDRNLEFDTRKNLFPVNFPGADVRDP